MRPPSDRLSRPGSIVVDIGTGTGVMSLLACRFGAGRVYAIEPDDAILVARENAVANGMAERIEFIQELSTKVSLPEKADVIVSDLHGVLPLLTRHLPSIIHARTNFCGPNAVLIPQRETLWLALSRSVGSPERPSGTVGPCFSRFSTFRRARNSWRTRR